MMAVHRAALLLALALCLGAAHAQNACPKLTNIVGCSECRKPTAALGTCLYCAPGYGEVWAGSAAAGTLRVVNCTLGTVNNARNVCQDINCRACVPAPGNPPTCIDCKAAPPAVKAVTGTNVRYTLNTVQSRSLSWAAGPGFGKCVLPPRGTFVHENTACGTQNPDGSCGACKDPRLVLVPMNALYTNGVFPKSRCLTRAQVSTNSAAAVGRDMTRTTFVPTGCAAVGTDFSCMRCAAGFALAPVMRGAVMIGYNCVKSASRTKNANGCLNTLPFQEYCTACNRWGTACLPNSCVRGRSQQPAGVCSLPCKEMFGITCLTCNGGKCLTADGNFPKGRR